jgi:hypothetical protein
MWLAMKPFAPVTRTVEPFSIGGMVDYLARMVLCGGTSLEWGLEGCRIKEDMERGYLAWEGYPGCISNQFIINYRWTVSRSCLEWSRHGFPDRSAWELVDSESLSS